MGKDNLSFLEQEITYSEGKTVGFGLKLFTDT
jgi:hypothetical protein